MDSFRGRLLYLGVFLTTLSSLVFEIALTRIFSVTLWYHFAYLAVSLALFGLGGGGLLAFFASDWLAPRFPRVLGSAARLQSASTVVCLAVVLGASLDLVSEPSPVLVFAVTGLSYVICAVPFVFVGLLLALCFRHLGDQVPRLYAADLIGSATGCLVFVAAIHVLSGPEVVLLAAGLSLVASFLLDLHAGATSRLPRTALVCLLAALGVLGLHRETRLFSVKHTKTYSERGDVLVEKWSPLARVTVHPGIFFRDDVESPFGWGLSPLYEGGAPLEQLWIQQDACAGTPITAFSGDPAPLTHLAYDITNLVFHAREATDSAFIIGPGGGRDVLSALHFRVPDIVACEINPVIVDLVRKDFRELAGDVYDRPGVRILVGEGRSIIRQQEQRFDVVMISLIDSWAATAAGAFALAENHLYTVEAFRDYLEHLTSDGYLSMTRYLFQPRSQSLRVVVVARAALEDLGVEEPARHVAVIGSRSDQGMATVLVKRTPFRPAEIDRIAASTRRLGFTPLYLPGRGGDPDFVSALTVASLASWTDAGYYDLRPSTDDWPFFFQMMHFRRVLDLVLHPERVRGQVFNYRAPLVLLGLLFLSTFLVAEFYLLPLRRSKRVAPLPRLFGVYFMLIGASFMFVEIPLLQKGALYLGHPTYSLTVGLFSMLVAAGLGSWWSARLPVAARSLERCLLTVVAVLPVTLLGSELLIRDTIAWPHPIRIALFVVLIAPVGFFMGTALPLGMRLVGREHGTAVPWVWALNGGASVLGSVLAMMVATLVGYRLTLVVGGAFYALALGTVRRLRSPDRTATNASRA